MKAILVMDMPSKCGNYKKLNKKDKKQLKIAEYKLKGMKGKK